MGLIYYLLPIGFGSISIFFRYFTIREIEHDKKLRLKRIKDLENTPELTIDQLSEESNQKEFLDKKEIFLKGQVGDKVIIDGNLYDRDLETNKNFIVYEQREIYHTKLNKYYLKSLPSLFQTYLKAMYRNINNSGAFMVDTFLLESETSKLGCTVNLKDFNS